MHGCIAPLRAWDYLKWWSCDQACDEAAEKLPMNLKTGGKLIGHCWHYLTRYLSSHLKWGRMHLPKGKVDELCLHKLWEHKEPHVKVSVDVSVLAALFAEMGGLCKLCNHV